MRNPEEQRIALDCLAHAREVGGSDDEVIARAERYLSFVQGREDAAEKLAAVRAIL